MKKQLQLIFELNELDQKVQSVLDLIEQIPARLEELEHQKSQRQEWVETQTKRMMELEKAKRDQEAEVEMSEARLKEFQLKLSQIKTNREYQAALKEVAETKKTNKLIEDKILEAMKEIETLQKGKQEQETDFQKFLEVFQKETQQLEGEKQNLERQREEFERARQVLLPNIDPVILAQYQRVRKVRIDSVTFVQSGSCAGCNMHIPPQLVIEIQKTNKIHTCPSCHRILCPPPSKEEK